MIMKSYDSRTYSINDFVEWDAAKQLELNPRFQRRPVWTEKAREISGQPSPLTLKDNTEKGTDLFFENS